METWSTLLIDVSDGVMTITLNRPGTLNAFNVGMMHEMIAAFDCADANDDVRAVIVTGAGERAFCAGADLAGGAAAFDYKSGERWSSAGAPYRADGSIDWDHEGVRDGGGLLALRIFRSTKPVIAALNGAAVGIGATMTLPMDFRFASETARLGFVFSRRGIVPEAASSWFLPRLVGMQTALEWCMSGRLLPASEALEAGLLRAVVPPNDLLPAVRRFARSLVEESSPVSVALTRTMMWRMAGASDPMVAHRLDSRIFWSRGQSADASEGIGAFLEKRPARFPDSVRTEMERYREWLPELSY